MENEPRDESANFEKALEKSNNKVEFYELRLYITGMTPNSVRAVNNIKHICNKYLPEGNYSLEIIDIYQNASLAKGEDIIATPTLVKKSPGRPCKLVGDLSNIKKVLKALTVSHK